MQYAVAFIGVFHCLLTLANADTVNIQLIPNRHSLFLKNTPINVTLTYYQHRLVINRVALIPCYLPDPNPFLSPSEPAAYEWLLNGRQIRPHMPFVYANWDLHGTLTVLAIMPRDYTLWCHVQLDDEVEEHDFYFGHQVSFFQEPIGQLIIGVSIELTLNEEAWERKCLAEQYVCDCKRMFGNNVSEIYTENVEKNYIEDIIRHTAYNVCNAVPLCMSVSLDDYECLNWENTHNSTHYVELSFFVDGGRREDDGRILTKPKLFAELYQNFTERLQGLKEQLVTDTANIYYALNPTCSISTYWKHYAFCMGYSGSLNQHSGECDLCPPGSFANARLTNPRPPYTAKNYKPLLSHSPYLSDRHSKDLLIPHWMQTEEDTICLTCPVNTYSEEVGRSQCLPCPVWHMRPMNKKVNRTIQQHGAHWLHLACPREGRIELRLVQVANSMLGTRFATWVQQSNPLTRVIGLVIIALIPLAIALLLLFIAYLMIDVGALIVRMAKKILPLQVQIAETTTAAASFQAEQKRAADEAYARTSAE